MVVELVTQSCFYSIIKESLPILFPTIEKKFSTLPHEHFSNYRFSNFEQCKFDVFLDIYSTFAGCYPQITGVCDILNSLPKQAAKQRT